MDTAKTTLRRQMRNVFIAAAMFRLLYILWGWSGWHTAPQSQQSKMYFRHGYAMAAGYGYVTAEDAPGVQLKKLYDRIEYEGFAAKPGAVEPLAAGVVYPDTAHPPGMPLLVAAFHRLFGAPAGLPVQFLGLFMDAAAAMWLCWLVSKALSPGAGYATGLIYALFPPLAHGATFNQMPDGLMSLFLVGAVTCVWMSFQPTRLPWAAWCAFAGLLMGLGSNLRPDYLLLPVALGAGAWAMTKKFWPSFRNLVTVQLITLVVMLPWAYRNHEICGRWVFTATGVGGTLITGLGEFSNPWGIPGTDQDRAREAAENGLSGPWRPDADVYFRGVFWRAVTDKPWGYVMSVIKRLPMALAPPLSCGLQNPYKEKTLSEFRQQAGMDRYAMFKERLAYILRAYAEMIAVSGVCFISLLGWGFAAWRERARWGVCFFLFAPHLYAIGSHLLTHFEPRFLLPTVGFLLIGLGYAVAAWRVRRASGHCISLRM